MAYEASEDPLRQAITLLEDTLIEIDGDLDEVDEFDDEAQDILSNIGSTLTLVLSHLETEREQRKDRHERLAESIHSLHQTNMKAAKTLEKSNFDELTKSKTN